MNSGKICIIGATGFVGRNLTETLLARGKRIVALVRHPEKAFLPGAEIVGMAGKFSFRGMDAVINLAGILHDKRPEGFEAVHVKLAESIAKACRDAGVPRLLHMSALGASTEGPSDYLKSKARGEEAVRNICGNSRTRFTIFRPSVILGKNDHFVSLFSNLMRISPILPIACPNSKLQPILVEDVARAFADSLELPGTFDRILGLCGPEVYTLLELVGKIAKCRRMRRWLIPLPDSLSYLQARMLEFTPGPLMTRDNYLSLQRENVCGEPFPFGWVPQEISKILNG